MTEIADRQWQVLAYFHAPPERVALDLAALSAGIQDAGLSLAVVPDADWVAVSQAALPPVRVGRILVHGSHDRAARRVNDIAMEIEAGQAFGTGHHGTTVGCLAAMAGLARAHRFTRILDLGSGSGVLAIAAARLWHAPVLATDIDPRAATSRRRTRTPTASARSLPASPQPAFATAPSRHARPFDLIVANILAGPLAALAPHLARHLAPGGRSSSQVCSLTRSA